MKIYCVFEEVYNWEGSWKNLKSLQLTEREAEKDKQLLEELNSEEMLLNDVRKALYFNIEEWDAE